ncbi:MAG: Crp/Fnr family transcriptional regulator [Pseudomonadota bacterium]|uniref:Crp/Fnr family transcriptional regulator n=1 Tax=Sphingobium sp. TaxID=1912891 RepID=UPI002E1DD66E
MRPPYHRLVEFVPLTASDVEMMRQCMSQPYPVAKGQTIRSEGREVDGVYFLLDGWVASSVMLKNGQRQIVKVHLCGDMLGFPSLAMARAVETLEAVSNATVAHIPAGRLGAVFAQAPRVAAAMLLSSQKERVALMHALSWLGATEAYERFVAFLIDIHNRLDAAGLVTNGRFDFPVRQHQIAEVIGVSVVHMNRIMKRLDRSGLIERGRNMFRITDMAGLKELAANRIPVGAGHQAWERLNPAMG